MDKLKEYLDYIVEFCQDHTAAVIAGAVVLVILLLCLVLVRSAQRQDEEDEMSEDSVAENGCPEEAEIFEAAEIDEIKEESKKDIDKDIDKDKNIDMETEMPSQEPAASELETEIVKAIGGGNLTALPAQFSTQNLKSVEVHIEKAHITFHYASPDEEPSLKESSLKESSLRKESSVKEAGETGPETGPVTEAETETATETESEPQESGEADRAAGDAAECGTAGQCGAKDGAECSTAGTVDCAAAECGAGMDFTETEGLQIDARPQAVKKYGAENRNVSRSGREYTVEELYVKIRD